MRILYVSCCTPRIDGSGSEQRSAVAVDALRKLGDVCWLEGPPTEDSFDASDPGVGAGFFVNVMSAQQLVADAPQSWKSFVRPGRMRMLLSDCWVTAGRVRAPKADESDALTQQLNRHFGPQRFDIIFAFQAQAGAFVEAVVSRLLTPAGLFAVDWDAAERPGVAAQSKARTDGKSLTVILRRHLNDLKLARIEKRLLKRASFTLCASQFDIEYFKSAAGHDRIACFPNCIQLPIPPAALPERPGHRVLFVGLINYWPNEQGLMKFLTSTWPKIRIEFPNAVFRIVGRGCTSPIAAHNGYNGVEVLGAVKEVGAHYAWCNIAVAPMTFSVGSSIKILEALAHKRPLVAYEISAHRHDLRPGVDIAVGRDDGEVFRELSSLMRDPEKSIAMAKAGFERVSSRYDRQGIVSGLANSLGSQTANFGEPETQ